MRPLDSWLILHCGPQALARHTPATLNVHPPREVAADARAGLKAREPRPTTQSPYLQVPAEEVCRHKAVQLILQRVGRRPRTAPVPHPRDPLCSPTALPRTGCVTSLRGPGSPLASLCTPWLALTQVQGPKALHSPLRGKAGSCARAVGGQHTLTRGKKGALQWAPAHPCSLSGSGSREAPGGAAPGPPHASLPGGLTHTLWKGSVLLSAS